MVLCKSTINLENKFMCKSLLPYMGGWFLCMVFRLYHSSYCKMQILAWCMSGFSLHRNKSFSSHKIDCLLQILEIDFMVFSSKYLRKWSNNFGTCKLKKVKKIFELPFLVVFHFQDIPKGPTTQFCCSWILVFFPWTLHL